MPMFANVAAVSVFMMQASGIDLIQGPLALLFKEMSLVQHSKYHKCTVCRGYKSFGTKEVYEVQCGDNVKQCGTLASGTEYPSAQS